MIQQTIGFVGGGRITRILLAGWQRAGVKLASVVVADPDAAALARLGDGVTTAGANNGAAARQQVVFLAVHPPVLPELLPQIAGDLREDALVVSLAPKFTLAKLAALLGGFSRLARVIPNAPSLVGCGFNPLTLSAEADAAARRLLLQLFEPLGAAPIVSEPQLEAYAVVTAMGPTYFWPQLVELINLAESFGMSPGEARTAVGEMIEGAVATLTESGLSAEEVLDLIPVKPLGDMDATFRQAYRTKLTAIFEKIRPGG